MLPNCELMYIKATLVFLLFVFKRIVDAYAGLVRNYGFLSESGQPLITIYV